MVSLFIKPNDLSHLGYWDEEKGLRTWMKVLAAVAIAGATLFLPDKILANENQGGHGEHVATVMALTPAHEAYFVTAGSGQWSEPSTWVNGVVPTVNAQVMIAEGDTVIFDTIQADRMEWVRVDGTLQFDHTVDTRMYVETLTVGSEGKLVIGTAENPIGANGSDITARITIADAGEDFDHSIDMQELGRGIVSMGRVEMNGADVTSYAKLAQAALQYDTRFVFDSAPKNWAAGDKLVVTGNGRTADETVFITDISENGQGQMVVSFDKDLSTSFAEGLDRDHTTPKGYGLGHYVANIDRNIVIESENPDIINRRGHVMFMHNQNVNINNAGFYGLGRTDKSKLVNDVSTDNNGNQVPGTNVRGRYAVHFHRAGTSADAAPGYVKGCVVVGSPGWGYVNHDSYVNMFDNVAYGVNGAAFVEEFGNERGTFTRNLAIRTTGGKKNALIGLTDRIRLFDHGFAGHGFWLHGTNVSVIDNIAAGSAESGFAYWGKGKGAGGGNVTNFIGNTNFGSKAGMMQWKFLRPVNVMNKFTVWNTAQVVWMPYGHNLEFKDSLIIGNIVNPRSTVITGTEVLDNLTLDNSTIVGWERIRAAAPLNLVVRDGYYGNVDNFVINPTLGRYQFFGEPQFAELTAEQLNGRTQQNIMLSSYTPIIIDLDDAFKPRPATVEYNGQQVYAMNQGTDGILFENSYSYTPDEFVGKTNQQLLDQYGLVAGGSIAPVDAVKLEDIIGHSNGLLGERIEYHPPTLLSARYTNNLDGYLLKFKTADGQVISETEPTQLNEKWNVITRVVNGLKQSVMVYGDITAPHFVEADRFGGIQRTVRYSQLHKGLRIGTRVRDASFGQKKVGFTLRGLNRLPIQLDYSNRPYVIKTISYRDKAGNVGKADVKVRITGAPTELPPHAATDSVTVFKNTSTVIDVLTNDSDPNRNDELTIDSVSQPRRGAVSLVSGVVTYTPNAGYTGADSFTYVISDTTGKTASGKVNIQVDPLPLGNNPPVALDDDYTTAFEEVLDVPAAGMLANDLDGDGDSLSTSLASSPANGSVTLYADGSFRYTPNGGFSGVDSFTYTADDGKGGTDTATVEITVNPNVSSIDAVDDQVTTDENTPVVVSVLDNDTDPDGNKLRIISFRHPNHGRVSYNGNSSVAYVGNEVRVLYSATFIIGGVEYGGGDGYGDQTLTYTPKADFIGTDSFTYTIDNGNGSTDTATVEVTVTKEEQQGDEENSEEESQNEGSVSFATDSNTVRGTASGSHLDTHKVDGTSQTITEKVYGKRKKKRSRLQHSWTFDVTGGDAVSFHAIAGHDSTVETFRFDYNDGSGWKELFTLTSQEMTSYSATLPASINGTVTVRVIDTNRAKRETSRDSVMIDEMHFSS